MKSRTRLRSLALVAAVSLFVAACGGGGGTAGGQPEGPPQPGGSVTVLLGSGFAGSWPSGLDPATNTTGGGNLSIMNSIFGGLFQLSEASKGEDAEIVPVLAEGYELSEDGRMLTIRLREGVEFSDGTPFNAEAVAWNIMRNKDAACTCAPDWPFAPQNPVTTPDDRTVQIHFSRPYAAAIHAFPTTNINWIASPTAFEQMGEEQFKIKPVGAGPFQVVSNQLSQELVLERNPNYFQEGRPYLDELIFQSIGGEQAAYQALLAGQADAFEGMTSTPLIEQAQNSSQLQVTQQPPTSPYVIQLNTSKPPFDNQRAREAIYYATNVDAIREGLFNNWYPVSQSFTGPGGLFHQPEVPGYRTYDLERARSIVQELGGLEVQLGTISSYVADQVNTALQSQWEEAGITTTIESWELSTLIQQFQTGEWDAMLQTSGSWDPEAGSGVSFRFASDRDYTGVWDPHLDHLLYSAAESVDPAQRAELYRQAGQYISDKAYAPFLFAFAPANVAVEGVYGPGLTTQIPPLLVNSSIRWDQVWTSNQ